MTEHPPSSTKPAGKGRGHGAPTGKAASKNNVHGTVNQPNHHMAGSRRRTAGQGQHRPRIAGAHNSGFQPTTQHHNDNDNNNQQPKKKKWHQGIMPTPPADLPIGGISRFLSLVSLDYCLGSGEPFYLRTADHPYGREELAHANRLCQLLLRHWFRLLPLANQLLSKPLRPADRRFSLLVLLVLTEMLLANEKPHAVSVIIRALAALVGERARANVLQAVIKRIEREQPTLPLLAIDTAIKESPLLKKQATAYGQETLAAMMAQYQQQPPIDLIFTSADAAKAFLQNKHDLPANSNPRPLPFDNMVRLDAGLQLSALPVVQNGTAWVQDLAASIAVRLLNISPNLVVADIGAAPGGKTRQLLAAGATVVAVEQSSERILRLQENLVPFREKSTIILGDITQLKPPRTFAAVLVDAPCSASGTMRKNPDVALIKNDDGMAAQTAQQKKILSSAWRWVGASGVLIYAVCSLEQEEGEEIIKTFLQEEKTARLVPITTATYPWLSFLPATALTDGFLRTMPHYLNAEGGMDGFFMAKLQRI
ncbi:MAG: RsmB/NOP family class I SAM-dependent RNA methyltransferase [Alphaproteobacteria bacterium]|nr:RsmB/NOP family class I SAM-dependent RNA methyltransferase [Alphaproteobacteria bacterium]